MLSIGEFSKICMVSVKALRRHMRFTSKHSLTEFRYHSGKRGFISRLKRLDTKPVFYQKTTP